MSISDLYSSGKHKQEIGHFASLVKIAQHDNNITQEEKALLDRAARRLNIGEAEYTQILKSPEKFPINAPVSFDDRIERLFRLTKMVVVDQKIDLHEVQLLRKIAIGLRFNREDAEKICDEALHLVANDNDLDTFTSAIKKVSKN